MTDSDKTKEQLSEESYRVVVENSLAGIAIAQEGRFVFANSRLAQIAGRTREEILGHSLWEFVHPDYRDMIRQRAERRERGEEEPEHYEFPALRKDGSTMWLELRAARIEFMGKPAILSNIIDITERKAAEKALRMREEKYRLLAENTTDVIFVQDMGLRLTYVSPSVERLSGHTVDEAMRMTMEDFLTLDSFRKAVISFQIHLAMAREDKSATEVPLMVYEYTRKDGSTFWGELKITFLRDSSGNLIGVQGVLRDITDRRESEQALKESENRLRLQKLELEEVNTALKVLLEHREEERREIAGKIANGLQRLVYPYIEKVAEILPQEGRTYLEILKRNLGEIAAPYQGSLESNYAR